MMGLLSLPIEILHHIFSLLDQQSRKKLRLTNGLLGEVGRTSTFRTARVSPFKQTSGNFRRILNDSGLAGSVAKIYIDTIDMDDDPFSPWNADTHLQNDGPNSYTESEINSDEQADYEIMDRQIYPEDIPRSFWRLVHRLSALPRLKSAVLRFHYDCSAEDNSNPDAWQTAGMRDVVIHNTMSVLASLRRPLRELAIQNLQNIIPTHPTTVANITKVLRKIVSLRLNITNQFYPNDPFEREDVFNFFPNLSTFWLKPTASRLEHLTIYSNLYFGFYPKCDILDFHFPRLKTLALGKYTFVHDCQLDLILSHGSTLQELYLDNCPILYEVAVSKKEQTLLGVNGFKSHPKLENTVGYASYGTRWHDYLRAFEQSLPQLQHFRLGNSVSCGEKDDQPFETETAIDIGFQNSYMVFCEGHPGGPYMNKRIYEDTDRDIDYEDDDGKLDASKEDISALKSLMAKLGQPVQLDDRSRKYWRPFIWNHEYYAA